MLSVKIKMSVRKPCIFIGSSLKDLRRFPAKVKNRVGFALNDRRAESRQPQRRSEGLVVVRYWSWLMISTATRTGLFIP